MGIFRCAFSNFPLTVSDVLGFTSYHISRLGCRSAAGGVHCCVVFAALATGHFLLMDTYRANSALQSSFFSFRLWLRFSSAVAVFVVQNARRRDVLKCHQELANPTSSLPSRTILFHFLVYLSHFLILHYNYRLSLFPNLYHGSLILFFAQVPAIQFEYLMLSVANLVRGINAELRARDASGYCRPRDRHSTQSERDEDREILKIRAKYAELAELAALVTATYQYQVIVVIASYFIEIFVIIQTFFFDFIKKSNFNTLHDFAFKAYFVLTFFLKVATLARAGESYLKECRKTDFILCRIMNNNSGRQSETRRFILLKILRPAAVNVSGLFQLDYRFLYNVGCSCINSGLIVAMFYVDLLAKRGGEGGEGEMTASS